MGKRVHNHGHHHESWYNEFHIGEPSYDSNSRTDKLSKYDVVECGSDHWWDNRLFPDPEKPADFFSDNRHIGYEEL